MPKFEDLDADKFEERVQRNAANEELKKRPGLVKFLGSLSESPASYANENIKRLCAEIDNIQGSIRGTINDYDKEIAKRKQFLADLRSGKVPYTTTLTAVQEDIKLLEERKKRALNIATIQIEILSQHLEPQIEREAKRGLEQMYSEFLKDVSVGETRAKVEINIKKLAERIRLLRESHKNLYGYDSENVSLARKSENRILELQIKSLEGELAKQNDKLRNIDKEEKDKKEIDRLGEEIFGDRIPSPKRGPIDDLPIEGVGTIFSSLKPSEVKTKIETKPFASKTTTAETIEPPLTATVQQERSVQQEPAQEPSRLPSPLSKQQRLLLIENINRLQNVKQEYSKDLGNVRDVSQGWGYLQYLVGGKKDRLEQLDFLQDLAKNLGTFKSNERDQNFILLGALLQYRDFLMAERSERWANEQGTSAIRIVNKNIESLSNVLIQINGSSKDSVHREALQNYKEFIQNIELAVITKIKNLSTLQIMGVVTEPGREMASPKPPKPGP